ncbi:hypothetical protein [Gorillibacterium sp. sgz5001074]|uniref:hypothetical protein n=1 Tax=Gorillibacterium sp. sgz5001074 TaxID=3446695 RepID=UPI003F669220
MSFLEQVWEHIRSGRIQNHPYPVALNVNLAYTVMLPDRETHLFWLPFEYTGLCYKDRGAFVNIHPYYKGVILDEAEISHGTDLYKPKTDEEFMKKLYQLAWDMECSIQARADQFYEPVCAADYILKMYHFAEWLRYYNSATIPRKA